MGVVTVGQRIRRHGARATRALGHVLAGHLDVDAARMRALGAMDLEEAFDFRQDALERARLVVVERDRVAMHGIAGPYDLAAFLFHRTDELRQAVCHLVVAETADQGQTASLVRRVQRIDQLDQIVGRQRRTTLQADRVLDAAEIFDMRMVELTRAVADPDHVARCRVPVAGGGIDTGQRLFVTEQQGLMAGEEIRLAQARIAVGADADRLHEVHGFGNAVGQLAVTIRLRAVLDEAEHPLVNVFEVGVTAHGESAQQVQRRRRLAVGVKLALGARNARGFVEFDAVDDVTAVGRQRHAILHFHVGRARLGELAGNASHLHHGQLCTVGQHHGHLQEGAEEVTDIVRAVLEEAFGAIAALQQEGVAFCHIGELFFQAAGFTCKDQRRIGRKRGFRRSKCCRIRIFGNLLDRFLPPAAGGPILCHVLTLPSTAQRTRDRLEKLSGL
ncbi:hypothetical protein AT6N2_C0675 [Agrobacterium tumefaciens]|nr:hypothetical protein AT6N2_C0675 [Agrobacterium tumefaciens]